MDVDKVIEKIPSMSGGDRKGLRENAEQWRSTGTPERRNAGEAVIRALDAQEEKEDTERIERVSGMPVAQRVVAAFSKDPLTETERDLVQVLLDNPGLNSTELSRKLNWSGKAWHLHFGQLCKARGANLWPAPRFDNRDASFYSGILADFDRATSGFTMKSEVAEAFAALGIVARRPKPA